MKLRIGTAGIPLSTPDRNTENGIRHVKKLGLDAMELEFVRSVNIKEEKAASVKKTAQESDVVLTCHGQYFVNLNAQDTAKLRASVERILKASEIAWKCGAWSICYHMAYYMGMEKERIYEKVKKQVKEIVKVFKDKGIDIWLRPETGGKLTQFGDVDELVKLSSEVEQVLPCIDWAHHQARSHGKVNSREEFGKILEKIERVLGREALENMHMHFEGIEYSDKGERRHKNFEDADLDFKGMVQAWKDFKIGGVGICESPNIEEDALLVKNEYTKS